jgi:hypothetical protein
MKTFCLGLSEENRQEAGLPRHLKPEESNRTERPVSSMAIAFDRFYYSPAIPCQCVYVWHRQEDQQVMLNFVGIPTRRPSALD